MPYRDRLNGEPLSADNVHKVFDYDPITGTLYRILITGRKKIAGTPKDQGHLITQFGGMLYPVTHIIWLILYKRFPIKNIEHKDLCPSNNKPDNIREADQSQNHANITVTSRSQSGVKGVFWDKARGKWGAYIGYNYKTYNLGRYDSIEKAKEVYDKRAKELFGEFARS